MGSVVNETYRSKPISMSWSGLKFRRGFPMMRRTLVRVLHSEQEQRYPFSFGSNLTTTTRMKAVGYRSRYENVL